VARWLLVAPGMRTRWLFGCGLVVLACSGKSQRTDAGESGGTGNAGTTTATGGTAGTENDSSRALGGSMPGTGSGDAGIGGEDSSTGGTDSVGEPRGGSSGAPSGGRPNVIGAAGIGGFTGLAGSGNGGLGGTPPSECSLHPAEFEPEAWTEVTDEPTLEERFDYVRSGIVGAWRGVVTTPWTAPYEVEAAFTEDGHYSASCVHGSNDCCIAFYYGTDDDADIKRYSIDDATLSGRVTGFIDIIFGTRGSYSEAAWQGELSDVDVDATGDRARFDFATSDGYGPIHFELERTNEE
jgi:hypothetical protein